MTTRHPHVGRPSFLQSASEVRWVLEALSLPYALPWLMRVPKGDGHPVLLLPGFMANEVTMIVMENYLRHQGYNVSHWGFGRNIGFQPKHAKALEQKIRYMHYTTGRKVSLVGWSLGGLFAMYGARQASECVRSVITMGSPIGLDASGERNVPRLLKAMYRLVAHPMGAVVHENQPVGKILLDHGTLTMPLSCLYGVSDGVVPPQEATVDGDPRLHENIRVPSSHLGLVINPMVLWIVADRLAQPEESWQPFAPKGWAARAYRLLTHDALPI